MIGQRIQELRIRYQISLEDLAHSAGLTPEWLASIENEKAAQI